MYSKSWVPFLLFCLASFLLAMAALAFWDIPDSVLFTAVDFDLEDER